MFDQMPFNVDPKIIDQAVALLEAGKLIGLPTETVYGLAANANDPQAVCKIFAAKGRPADHPLIVHLGADELLTNYARDIPEQAWILAEAFWPGPLTLILKKAVNVPDVVTGGQDTVGVRIPAHPLALAVLRAFAEKNPQGGGLAAPSANKFGHISPTLALHVHEELGDAVSLILDGGDCQVGIESTIVDLSRDKPVILRPGLISAEQISLVLGETVLSKTVTSDAAEKSVPRVSGSMASHYAPLTPLSVLTIDEIKHKLATENCAAIIRTDSGSSIGLEQKSNVALLPDQATAFAHDFYRALRELDAKHYTHIYVETLPATKEWVAVQDRLGRAAYKEA